MRIFRILGFSLIILLLGVALFQYEPLRRINKTAAPISFFKPRQGLWISVFTKEKIMYSVGAVARLMDFCRKHHIDDIYLQVYRAGRAYYDSHLIENDEYQNMRKEMGQDPIDYLLRQASQRGIKVHAWVNVLSLAQNKKAPILEIYDRSILTKDRQGRVSIRTQDINSSDSFYQRDDQQFLEPGDSRVIDFTLKIINEISMRYPQLAGLHLDYIRYPYPIPFIPDGRFMDVGLSYGFGDKSVGRFIEEFKLNPLKDSIFAQDLYLKWDEWRRSQVTNLVNKISKLVRKNRPNWLLSAAVMPDRLRAYQVAFQDWGSWLDTSTIDYVILMNYTRDDRLFKELTMASLTRFKKEQIHVGLGNFLLNSRTQMLRQYGFLTQVMPQGIVYFAYDGDMLIP